MEKEIIKLLQNKGVNVGSSIIPDANVIKTISKLLLNNENAKIDDIKNSIDILQPHILQKLISTDFNINKQLEDLNVHNKVIDLLINSVKKHPFIFPLYFVFTISVLMFILFYLKMGDMPISYKSYEVYLLGMIIFILVSPIVPFCKPLAKIINAIANYISDTLANHVINIKIGK